MNIQQQAQIAFTQWHNHRWLDQEARVESCRNHQVEKDEFMIRLLEELEKARLRPEFIALKQWDPSFVTVRAGKSITSVDHSVVPESPIESKLRPFACIGCQNYHGSDEVICAIHPQGMAEDCCPDWEEGDSSDWSGRS
jgi:hypothetical protein